MKKDVVSKVWQLIFLLALSIPMSGFAQAIQVKGTVLDASGMTVIGASVLEKGTTNGVITDMDGNFELSVSPKGTLVISYVGFQTQEIAVNNQRNFKITLKEDTEVLDEVVVVGYGTMKKSDMTGAISSVDVDELTKRTTTNPAEALQGKIAGVNIMKSGGNAGAGVSVKIRGVKSFGDNEPLYIIDGFPGDINSVNPVDIQSMEVLKDGAAAAIYGSVAANGVVIITTKNGKKGETHIDFNTYLSMTTVAKRMEFLNAEQYKSTIKQMYINAGREDEIPAYCTTDTGVDTNWQDEMMRNGLSQNYMFSVRGGGETAQYSVSYNHADDKGIFLGNDFRQDNARMKLHMSKYIFDLDANLGFRYTKSHQPTYSLKEVYNISPLVPVYDENEKYGFGLTASQGLPSNNNPMADYYYQDETEKTFSTTANVSLGIKITSWLNFKTSYAYRGKHYRYTLHYPDYISNAQQTHLYPYNSESTYYWEEQTIDNILNFNKEFGKHSLNAMIGSSITSTKNTSNGVAVEGFATRYTVDKNGNLVSTNEPSGFLDPSFDTIDAGKGGTYTGEGTKYEYNRASFFGRINYGYKDKYLAEVTLRYDGSMNFAPGHRWGLFPAFSLGWVMSEEKFFEPIKDVVSFFKLKGSWGMMGNDNIAAYQFMSQYKFLADNKGPYFGAGEDGHINQGFYQARVANPVVTWEKAKTLNLGLSTQFLNGKFGLDFDWFHSNRNDILCYRNASIPYYAGMTLPQENIGEVTNSGIEIIATYRDRAGDFEWGITGNLTYAKNKVNYMDEAASTPAWQKTEGHPIDGQVLYKALGIYQTQEQVDNTPHIDGAKPGDLIYQDTNGDGNITWDDAIRIDETATPKIIYGFTLNGGWKGIDLNMFFQGQAKASQLVQPTMNMATDFYEGRWKEGNTSEENANARWPKAFIKQTYGDTWNGQVSTWWLRNASFLRLKSVELGYTLPKDLTAKVGIQKARIYVNGANLFTIDNYKIADPEAGVTRNDNNEVINSNGVLSYPLQRTITFGANITF